MTPVIILMAASALGVEAGWQPLAEGGHQYTIQIEPSLVSVLQNGNEIVSEVPPQVDVRRFRVVLGTGKLSRIDGPPRREQADALAAPRSPAPETAPDLAADLPPADDWPALPPTEAPAKSPANASPFDDSAGPDTSLALPSVDEPADEDTFSFGEAGVQPSPSEPAPEPAMPANFEQPPADALPLADQAADTAATPPQSHGTQKPRLDAAATVPERPWMLLLSVVVILACSLGANFYLGWMFWDARQRLRNALARTRPAAA